ncbi:hypothetical protein LINGRAHAP2_LOCUS1746, partial [Linum grandiflorum]
MDHLTKWSITQPFGLRLAHRQRLWIRDNEGNLLGSSSEVGYSRGCSTEPESREHLFLNCWVTQACLQTLPLPVDSVDNLSLFWRLLIMTIPADEHALLDKLAFLWWRLWKNRNDIIFNHIQWTPASIIKKSTLDYESYSSSIRQEFQTFPSGALVERRGQPQGWLPP